MTCVVYRLVLFQGFVVDLNVARSNDHGQQQLSPRASWAGAPCMPCCPAGGCAGCFATLFPLCGGAGSGCACCVRTRSGTARGLRHAVPHGAAVHAKMCESEVRVANCVLTHPSTSTSTSTSCTPPWPTTHTRGDARRSSCARQSRGVTASAQPNNGPQNPSPWPSSPQTQRGPISQHS